MADKWGHRIDNLNPRQKIILSKIWNKIKSCEGMDLPKKYWCDSCKLTWVRFFELIHRFETVNDAHTLLHQSSSYGEYNQFSKADSSNDHYRDSDSSENHYSDPDGTF